MDNKNIIGPNLKRIRQSKNLTQEQLTARIQVRGLKFDRTMLSKIETKTREVVDFEVKAIADALEIPIQDLFSYKK